MLPNHIYIYKLEKKKNLLCLRETSELNSLRDWSGKV